MLSAVVLDGVFSELEGEYLVDGMGVIVKNENCELYICMSEFVVVVQVVVLRGADRHDRDCSLLPRVTRT